MSRSNANGAAALVDVLHFTGEGGGESIIGCVNVTSIAKDTTAMLQSVLRTFLEEESSTSKILVRCGAVRGVAISTVYW